MWEDLPVPRLGTQVLGRRGLAGRGVSDQEEPQEACSLLYLGVHRVAPLCSSTWPPSDQPEQQLDHCSGWLFLLLGDPPTSWLLGRGVPHQHNGGGRHGAGW